MTSQAEPDAARRSLIAAAMRGTGLDAALVDEMQYRDRYRVLSGNLMATADVFFDGRGRVTGVEAGAATTAASVVMSFIEAIENIDTAYLRPRFSARLASPAVLVDLHRRHLEAAELEICGLRLAQFQIMYDIEDPRNAGSVEPLALKVWYNRRGVVTAAACDDNEIGLRAVHALDLAHCVEHRKPPDDPDHGE